MPTISIIVPVYNCEEFLPTCISSLRAQTFGDIELIFVCDASTDRSLEILRAAEKADSRIRVIAFEQNQGVSAARNAGIEAAQGEFIGFCDGDDWVEPDMYESLYAAALGAQADITFCRVFKNRPDGTENVPLGFPTGTKFDRESIRKTLIPAMLSKPTDSDELPLSGYTPRNLFRRETIGDRRFRPDIRYAEDLLFIVECMLNARRAAAIDEAYYHYRFHAGSVTKRYSPHVPKSHDLSNDALDALFENLPECKSRMVIRRRKMAITAVRNVCQADSPYIFKDRVQIARAYMRREDVRRWFADVQPHRFPLQMGVKLALLKWRLALAACILFSYVFKS